MFLQPFTIRFYITTSLKNISTTTSLQISKAANVSKYAEIAMRADAFAECQPFGAVCDRKHDLGQEVHRVLAECQSAEAKVCMPITATFEYEP